MKPIAFADRTQAVQRKPLSQTLLIQEEDGSEVLSTNFASGSGLSRVLSQLGSEKDFAIFTNFRRDNTKAQNESTFKAVPALLRKTLDHKNVGGYWLVGHWLECQGASQDIEKSSDCLKFGGEIVDSVEYSWLFVCPPDVSSEAFEKAVFETVRHYKQDAYVIRSKGITTVKSGKNGQVWDTLQADATALEDFLNKSSYMNANFDQWGYSELRKNTKGPASTKMVFLPKSSCKISSTTHYLAIPRTPKGGLEFKAMGALYLT